MRRCCVTLAVRRVRRTVDGETTWYLGSGLEIDEAGTEKISLGAVTYSDGEIWAHNLDHLGTPGYTVSWATGVETFRRFTPFGSPRSNATENAGGASDLTFTGQRDDGELDLMYYGGRFYDPLVGQFTRPDPVTPNAFGSGAGWNRFAYVFNNPVMLNDPSGFCPPNSTCYSEATGSTADSSYWRLRSEARSSNQLTEFKQFESIFDGGGDAEVAADFITSTWAGDDTGYWGEDATRDGKRLAFWATSARTLGPRSVESTAVWPTNLVGGAGATSTGHPTSTTPTTNPPLLVRKTHTGAQYSVLFELQLAKSDFGAGRRQTHARRANAALHNAMKSDPGFARLVQSLSSPGAMQQVSGSGGRANPSGWQWHHAHSSTVGGREGVMQLVPKSQHSLPAGARFQATLHPNGAGGWDELAHYRRQAVLRNARRGR